jgi:protein-S-isoprenylcysteine O-methyltransferase Ste14/rhodanese-related sulfurtransferase
MGRTIAITEHKTVSSGSALEKLQESRLIPVVFFLVALVCLVVTGLDNGFSPRQLSTFDIVIAASIAAAAVFVLSVSLFQLICYFVFIPSLSHHAHLFGAVHRTQMLHPLFTAILLGLAGLCVFTGSSGAWILWVGLLAVYILQTVAIVERVRRENLMNGTTGSNSGVFLLLLNLILGAEVVTVAAGARPLPPWRLSILPENTWIVDVRTKPEFYWNRLQGAESYPWGTGLVEAAKTRSVDQPVLVTCLSGHRSPAVAVMLRKLGFKTVYNLNWGIVYLLLLERGRKSEGPFALTRPHRDPTRRGEDLKGISIGYIVLQFIILILAPLESAIRHTHVSTLQQAIAAVLGFGGLLLGWMSFRALGRNFRIYAAPRRSGTLVTSGVYSHIRHPMYVAAIAIFAGYWLYFGSLLSVPLWLAFSILYLIKVVKEERILTERFPEYKEYRKHSWRFIPYVF